MISVPVVYLFFFFNDTATTEIYTLSLHDALPISTASSEGPLAPRYGDASSDQRASATHGFTSKARILVNGSILDVDRKSTRLNSSHSQISYAVFCLKKKTDSASGLGVAPSRKMPS